MDTEYRRNGKDWLRLDSFLGWQGLYVFPQEGVLTTPPCLGKYYSCSFYTVYKFECASVILVVCRRAVTLNGVILKEFQN